MIQRCEIIFNQDDEKNRCTARATELFFEEVLMKRTSRLVCFICANGIMVNNKIPGVKYQVDFPDIYC
jgi:hypothetical protein